MTVGPSIPGVHAPAEERVQSERRASVSRGGGWAELVRARGFTAACLIGIVGLSTAVRAGLALRVPSPWILPDEIVYSDLAKSIAAGGFPSVRGVPELGWGVVYQALIAPAWALFEDPYWAYRAALATNAFVMSLAAVPAYLLARLFVSRRASFLVAVMTVLVPSMAYTGVVMTENAFYPVFLFSVWLIARVVRRPTVGSQALALLGLGVVAFTRVQGLALVGAYVAAVLFYAVLGPRAERGAYVRRFVPTAMVACVAALVPVTVSLFRGDGALGWLGARSGTFDAFHPSEVPKWFAYLTADLLLYVAIVPGIATALVVGSGLSRRASERLRLFAALGLPVFAAMLASVSLVSASLDVDGRENLNERYVFYVVPLMFIGLALWIREGLPRPRPWAVVAVAASCALAALLPVDRLRYNANFQSLALMPWFGPVSGVALYLLITAFAFACSLLWWTCRPVTVGRLWVLVAATMTVVFVSSYVSEANSASYAASVFEGRAATWLDDSLPPGARVGVVWDEQHERGRTLDPLYPWIMVTEFFNTSVGDVYRIGPATYYEKFLPTIPVRLDSDGSLVLRDGRRVEPRYALVSCRTPVAGHVVARGPRGVLELVEVQEPLRLEPARCR